MTIFVDATTSEHARGIGTVIERVTGEMSADERVIIARGPSAPREGVALHTVGITATRPGRLLYQRLLLPFDVARLRRRGMAIDQVVLLDAYIPLPLAREASRAKYGVLVHDALPVTHPHFWPPATRLVKKAAFLSLQQARPLVFTSTEHNAKAIQRLLKVETRVAPFGCGQLTDLESEAARHDPLVQREQYLVAIGAFEPRKNLLSLIESFERVQQVAPDFSLHLVGGGRVVGSSSRGYEALLSERLARSTAASKIFVHRDLDRAGAIRLIRHASVLALPSLAEGFGLPIIEALALGTPVVASDLPEIRSWADGAISYASPHEPADWVEPLLASTEVTDEKRRAGQEFASTFRWKECATSLLEW